MKVFLYECKKVLNIKLLLLIGVFTALFYYLFMQCMTYPRDNASSVAEVQLSDMLMEQYGTTLPYEDSAVLEEIREEQVKKLDELVAADPILKQAGITGWKEMREVVSDDQRENFSEDSFGGVSFDEIEEASWEIEFGSGIREMFLIQAIDSIEEAQQFHPFMGVEKGKEEEAALTLIRHTMPRVEGSEDERAAVKRVAEVIEENRMSLRPESAFEYVGWDLPKLCLLMLISCMVLILPCGIREKLSGVYLISAATVTGRKIWRKRRCADLFCAGLMCVLQAAVFLGMLAARGILKYASCPASGGRGGYLWTDVSFGGWILCNILLYLVFAVAASAVFHLISRMVSGYIAGLAAGIPAAVLLGIVCMKILPGFLNVSYGRKAVWLPILAAGVLALAAALAGGVCRIRDGKRDIG